MLLGLTLSAQTQAVRCPLNGGNGIEATLVDTEILKALRPSMSFSAIMGVEKWIVLMSE